MTVIDGWPSVVFAWIATQVTLFAAWAFHLIHVPRMLMAPLSLQEEGIIIKALDSPWQMNDRSNTWLKIKPDYVHSNDIDAVIIGAFYGTGRHGGQVTQWLLALAEAPPGGSQGTPSNFMSFCKYAMLSSNCTPCTHLVACL